MRPFVDTTEFAGQFQYPSFSRYETCIFINPAVVTRSQSRDKQGKSKEKNVFLHKQILSRIS